MVESSRRADSEGTRGDQHRAREFLDVKEQLAATNEVLTALGRSTSDADSVLGVIVETARRLSRADAALIYRLDDGVYRLARSVGLTEAYLEYTELNPLTLDSGTLIGRVGLEHRTLQLSDVLADRAYGRRDVQQVAGYRSIMAAPLLLDGDVIGVLVVWRNEVDPFDERALSMLTAFALQAAIAIRQVDLVRALEARSAELARRVDQLEALGEVGAAVASSLDLDQVLATIVTNAVQLSGTDGGSLMEFDEREQRFFVRTAFGSSPDLLERLRTTRIDLDTTFVGRSALEGRPLQVEDLEGHPLDPHLQQLYDAGWRSLVAVPMRSDGGIVGVLVVRRRVPGPFSDEVCELLQTFAGQSSLAILNARLFRQLEMGSSELAVASRHKSEFLASMSHELRTPLNAVIGFSEVLLERMFGEINERQEEYLRDIWSSGKHLLELLNEILDLSKVEAGRMELDYSNFSVRDSLEYGLSLVRERAAQHGISLSLDVDRQVGLVYSDELRLRQVVVNLLTNAVKFTGDGGSIHVRAFVDGAQVVISVRDTGIGVPPEHRERIFESFQQGSRAPRQQEGTGLGLTLSRRIVELFGGRLWLESEVGVGSTFSFTVPGNMAGIRQRQAATDADPHAPVVVVVEDDPRSLDLMTLYLDGAGITVLPATDGSAGLALVRSHQPTAVVLDIRLQHMDGWEVLTELKQDPATAAIPVIIVSILDERARGLALGASDYLVKPVAGVDLLKALERVDVVPRKVVSTGGLPVDGAE